MRRPTRPRTPPQSARRSRETNTRVRGHAGCPVRICTTVARRRSAVTALTRAHSHICTRTLACRPDKVQPPLNRSPAGHAGHAGHAGGRDRRPQVRGATLSPRPPGVRALTSSEPPSRCLRWAGLRVPSAQSPRRGPAPAASAPRAPRVTTGSAGPRAAPRRSRCSSDVRQGANTGASDARPGAAPRPRPRPPTPRARPAPRLCTSVRWARSYLARETRRQSLQL